MEESVHAKYLVVNDIDLLWGITVNSVGYHHIKAGDIYPPQNHPAGYLFSTQKGRVLDEYQLIYLTKGKGVFMSGNNKREQIKSGNMYLLFPGEWHNYMPDSQTGWDEYWIGFKGINIDNRVVNEFFNKQKPIFTVGLNEEIVHLYQQAIQVAQEQKAGFQQMLAGIVNHLLGLAYSLNKNFSFENTHTINLINKAKVIIREELFNDITPESIAVRLHISYSSFRKIFKEYTGFAPQQYIKEIKIQKAKEMLTNTDFSVKEIAYSMHYDNPEYFFTAFKKITGMTPNKYRSFTRGEV